MGVLSDAKSEKMWWAKNRLKTLYLEWETTNFSRENLYWDTEGHEGGHSPTERLRERWKCW